MTTTDDRCAFADEGCTCGRPPLTLTEGTELEQLRDELDEARAENTAMRRVCDAAEAWRASQLDDPPSTALLAIALGDAIDELPNTQEPCGICSGYGCPDCASPDSRVADLSVQVAELTAELDRVRADLAAAHNHAHRQDTNLQQIARAKDEIAAERDALKEQLAEILAMAERFDTPRDSSRVRVFLGDLKHLAYKAITEHKVAVAR